MSLSVKSTLYFSIVKRFLFVSFCLLAFKTHAGGWLKGENKGFFKLGQSVYKGSQMFGNDGKTFGIPTTGVFQTSFYAEYGISKNFDVIAYVPFFSRSTMESGQLPNGSQQDADAFNSIGDSDLGIKYGIRQNKSFVISASLILGLPIGDPSGGESGLLQSGDGEFNQVIMLDFGYGFNFPLYTNLGLGFNNRTKDYSEEFRATFEMGYKWKEKLILAFKFSAVQSLMNGKQSGNEGFGLYSNNLEYVSYGPELTYEFKKKWGVTASYFTASSGRNLLAVAPYHFGIYYEIK